MVDFVKFKKEKEKEEKPKRTRKRKLNIKAILLIILAFFIISSIISSISYSLTPKIAVVPIKGIIANEASNTLYGETMSSRETAQTLRSLKSDTSVKAILLDINSPGGSPVASEEIARAIEEVKLEKPVYAVVGDVGASGAYWVGASSTKLYASKLSVIGSIGVTSAGLGFENLIKEYNITYRQNTAGEYKDMGSQFREPTTEENEMMQKLLGDLHLEFKTYISESRNISLEELTPYAQGQIFLGQEAMDIGLIDGIGYYDTAIKELRNISESPGAIIVSYEPEETLSDILGFSSIFKLPSTQNIIMFK